MHLFYLCPVPEGIGETGRSRVLCYNAGKVHKNLYIFLRMLAHKRVP